MASRFLRKGKVKLDEKNRKLLSLLCLDGRASATRMGRQLRLSREVVGYRMRRLEETGVIQGHTLNVRYKRLGARLYRIMFLLDEQQRAKHAAFQKCLIAHPSTVSVCAFTDTWDISWLFACETVDEFDIILTQILSEHADVIIEFEKSIVLTTYVWHMLPATQRPRVPHISSKERVIDETDAKLLQQLSANGRASTYAIGAAVGLSSDAVLQRLKRLRNNEVFANFTPVVNIGSLGYTWHVYVMQFSKLTKTDEARLAEYVGRHPHIIRATKMFGRWHLMLDIAVHNDEEYHETVKETKNVFADIIKKYESWTVYEELYYNAFPPALLTTAARGPAAPSRNYAARRTGAPRGTQAP